MKSFEYPKSKENCEYIWVSANVKSNENIEYMKILNHSGYIIYAAESYQEYLAFKIYHKHKGGRLFVITSGKLTEDVVKNTYYYN